MISRGGRKAQRTDGTKQSCWQVCSCVEKDQTVVGHLKKGDSGKFAKTIFYFVRSDTYCQCYTEVSGKRCNLKDGKGLQVSCKIIITVQKNYVNILKHELQKINELS